MVRRLHVGGTKPHPDWEILNINHESYVDHVGNVNDLSRFEDKSFLEIYASHIIEHLDYVDELETTLKEFNRILTDNGRIYISVPDLDILCKLFLDRKTYNTSGRFFIMRMMFGGHVDKSDYHVVGLNEEFLRVFLSNSGFASIIRVEDFGIFKDTSIMKFEGIPISLNLIAEKKELKICKK